jgi:hypothetical protein
MAETKMDVLRPQIGACLFSFPQYSFLSCDGEGNMTRMTSRCTNWPQGVFLGPSRVHPGSILSSFWVCPGFALARKRQENTPKTANSKLEKKLRTKTTRCAPTAYGRKQFNNAVHSIRAILSILAICVDLNGRSGFSCSQVRLFRLFHLFRR